MSAKGVARAAVRALVTSPVRIPLRGASRAGLVPRSVWMRLPVTGTFPVRTRAGRSFTFDGSTDDAFERKLHWRGLRGLEPETLLEFQRSVEGAEVVVDVGANRGLFTLTALATDPDVKVVAVEASPGTFAHLGEMVALNGWSDRVEAHNVAAGAEADNLPFHVPRVPHASSARLVDSSHRSDATVGDVIEVPVVPLDDLVPRADVVKIDVEGAEHMVLAGMTRLLDEVRPAVFVEVLAEGEVTRCEELLAAARYRFFHLTDDGPVERDGLVADPTRRLRNYVCRP